MNQTLTDGFSIQPQPGLGRVARLGDRHGYRFDADTVSLNAMFTVLDAAAHQRQWALQLWACPQAPSGNLNVEGHLVAEAALPPIGEIADDTEGFEVRGFASLPAGGADHVMVLALASGRNGRFDEVHDLAVYPRRERFVLPRLAGNAGYRVNGNHVRIEVDRIENPRDAASASGTLALELWALPAPYAGGAFQGTPCAGVSFQPLAGRHEFVFNNFDLPFAQPPAGTWNLVLMLREWTSQGFVTRDFVNFALPVTYAAAPVQAPRVNQEPVIPAKASAPRPVPAAPVRLPVAAPETAKAAAARPVSKLVSVNSASVAELKAIKGLPARVAEDIVKSRPFARLEDLIRVRGMGAKLLEKIRSKLRL